MMPRSERPHAAFGLLNLDKPAGASSRDVVNIVQRLVRPQKVGHAGTLDPLATGVLVICVGPATRLIPFLQQGRKTYRATFRFGVTSPSEDLESEPTAVPDAPPLSQSDVDGALPAFIGSIAQIPPAFSAVHVDGRRAYELARAGQTVQIAPRTVEIHRFELRSFDEHRQELDCEIECGSGTYIRSLGRDLARSLGTGAVMTTLRRTAVGPFTAANAVSPRSLDHDSIATALLPVEQGLGDMTRVEVDGDQVTAIRHGLPIALQPGRNYREDEPVALLTTRGVWIGIARFDAERHQFRPRIVFPAEVVDCLR